jgi:hypothetical protein
MDGYRVSARIDRGVLHRPRPWTDDRESGTPPPAEVAPVDLVGRPIDVILAERWEAIRERWAQTTFFLFDPDSWRT